MRSRFNEMMAKTDPPEPECPRCGAYIGDDWEDELQECQNCGYDGTPRYCVHCNSIISPRSENYGTGLCDKCTAEEDSQRWALGEYDPRFEEE